jgi:hypothetical protein
VATFGRAALSRQFDLDADRGNSDFDQRHNLTLFYTYHVPGSMILVRNWLIAGIAAFRSGVPITVISPSLTAVPGQGVILNNRPDLLPGASVFAPTGDGRSSVQGGQQFLNPAAFQSSSTGSLGNLGRGAFAGPGFYSVDLSLARSFAVGWLGDAGRLQFRADAFNVLNHTNLGNPDTVLGSPTFGVARFGRIGRSDGFPPLTPLAESARQLQMSVQLSF